MVDDVVLAERLPFRSLLACWDAPSQELNSRGLVALLRLPVARLLVVAPVWEAPWRNHVSSVSGGAGDLGCLVVPPPSCSPLPCTVSLL